MTHSKLDDIAARNRTASITDWLFAVLALAVIVFMAGALRAEGLSMRWSASEPTTAAAATDSAIRVAAPAPCADPSQLSC